MAPTPSTENIARAMGSGPKAMAIVWTSPHHQETMYCITTPSPKLTWHDLPLLSKLGVNDIQYAKPDPNDKKGMPDMFDTRNRTLELFTSNCDPASDSCGLTTYLPAAQGQVLFRRANDPNSFEGVGKSTLEPIELFIEDRLRAIQATIPDHCVRPDERPNQAATIQECELLNPKMFKQFFKHYRGEQASKYKGIGWEKTVCPVDLGEVTCEGCGREEITTIRDGVPSSNLKKCGRCSNAVLQEVKDARDGFLARGEVWSSAWEENQEGDDGVVLWFI
ncbi:unnamed protein product [Zymoseptoria tritici ST99CH_1A5]|uniref:Uncharacterized protein n=3 Tax=Zymoseptoria tritici TaxID=1047171 RepID=A0A1X7RKU1_ZYMT9|nr:unnamed protein product [Zymoseptoria tritici ST99CH_3D7]SMR46586.1 unnamed protein product [Zymoseptoria tritici ST99CH_1E4]SMY21735.1 unnamed protein product [Zymoseptoria tritici ST99CH_1A5]